MKEFLQLLKERKRVQWALAYVAAVFALLQGIDIVAQQFGWPESARCGMALALVVGFLLTLVLAWYHVERGAQRMTGTKLLILALLNRFRRHAAIDRPGTRFAINALFKTFLESNSLNDE